MSTTTLSRRLAQLWSNSCPEMMKKPLRQVQPTVVARRAQPAAQQLQFRPAK
jgi:hypothetical protein